MVCEDPSQTRVHEVMCRPVRAFPCRIICYSPPPLTQHPRHAAEALFQRIDAHTFGSYESASTTLEAQHSKDQKQHARNANSLPSTMNTASIISDMIAPPGHLSTGLLGFPHLVTPTSAAKQWVCQARYRPPQELSLLLRSCGVGHGLSATLSSFPAVLSSYEFPRHWSGPAGP